MKVYVDLLCYIKDIIILFDPLNKRSPLLRTPSSENQVLTLFLYVISWVK